MLEHGVHFRLSEICTKTTFDKHFSKIDSILKSTMMVNIFQVYFGVPERVTLDCNVYLGSGP